MRVMFVVRVKDQEQAELLGDHLSSYEGVEGSSVDVLEGSDELFRLLVELQDELANAQDVEGAVEAVRERLNMDNK